MKSIIIHFKVKQDKISFAKEIIKLFVDNIKVNEQATVQYQSLQEKEDPTRFTHIMTFKNEQADEAHRNAHYTKEFVEKLYPICTKEPQFSEVELVAVK